MEPLDAHRLPAVAGAVRHRGDRARSGRRQRRGPRRPGRRSSAPPTRSLRSPGWCPTISTDAGANSVRFSYPAFDDPANQPRAIDLLFTVTASNQPFADGLFLTNQARSQEGSDQRGRRDCRRHRADPAQRAEPARSQGSGHVQQHRRRVRAHHRGTGRLHGAGQRRQAVGRDHLLQRARGDPDQQQRLGARRRRHRDLRHRRREPGKRPGGGVRRDVPRHAAGGLRRAGRPGGTQPERHRRRRNGAVRSPISAAGRSAAAAGSSATASSLVDPGAAQGALRVFDNTAGTNIAVITYDLQLASTIAPNQALTNTATLTNYAGTEGGPDFTSVDPTDPATVTTAAPSMTKAVTGTNQAHTVVSGGLENVAIGEIVTYTLTVRVPEGTTPAAVITDTLDAGLAFVAVDSITASSAALTTSVGTFDDVRTAAVISNPSFGRDQRRAAADAVVRHAHQQQHGQRHARDDRDRLPRRRDQQLRQQPGHAGQQRRISHLHRRLDVGVGVQRPGGGAGAAGDQGRGAHGR